MTPETRTRVVTEIRVTPELAERFLENNYYKQRSIKTNKVKEFARDIKEGRWNEVIFNPIKFTRDGELIDGQHRLAAIVDSGVPIWIGVQEDLTEYDFNFIDIGSKRIASDFIKQEKNSKNLAAVARMAYATKNGNANLSGILHGFLSTSPKEFVSVPCITKEAEDSIVKQSSEEGCHIRKIIKCGAPSIYGYGIWVLKWLFGSAKLIDDYIEDFTTITPSQSTAVIIAYIKNSAISGKKLTIDEQLALFLYGYECFITGKKLKVYQPNNGALKRFELLINVQRKEEVSR